MADTPNHFFKLVPPGFKFNLSIPKSFLTRLDGWSGKKAILSRGRLKWPVHIDDGGVFGDGWKKFVAENGVQEFDIIVFKHQGDMVFDFFVFDPSGCEKQYPYLSDHVEEHIPESESDLLHTHKRSKMLNMSKRADCSSRSKDEFRLEDDSCFVSIMTPYNIKNSTLNVPMKFARSNGLTTIRMHTQIVLVDQAKRTCPARLHIKTDRILLTGWRKLIKEEDLIVGDTLMFELVKAGEVPVFKFYNLGRKHTNNHIDQVNKETSSTIKKTTGSSLGNHPYFILTMKPSYRETALYLPVEFSKSNGLKVGEMILRDDEGRSWKIQLKKTKEKYLCFGRGFRAFWDANGLKVGDEYKFVLVQKEKCRTPIMNVSLNVDSAPSIKEEQRYYISKVRSNSMYLPSKLVKTNGLLNKEKIILKNDDERSWIMDIKHERNYSYIGRGWKDFCVANGLNKEDLIKLKPVSNGEIPVVKFCVQKVH